MNAKEKLLRIVNGARGDDLERAELAFRFMSPTQMQTLHGDSGITRQQLLDGYRRERLEWEAAQSLAKTMLDK